jgi:alkylation response protein AidB-like acyl-CoA dehydrogenase
VDFDCGADTAAMRGLATRILREQSTPERLTALDTAGTWFDQRTYQALAGAGVLGAAFAEDVGGAGLGLLELHYVLEQAGATTAHVPLVETVVGALTIERFGSAAQRQQWLPGVVAGRTLLSTALTEPGPVDPLRPRTRGVSAGTGWTLTGSKSQVPLADTALRILVPAQLPNGATGVFLVDPRAAGVTLAAQHTADRRPVSQLELSEVAVGMTDRIGGDDVLADLVLRVESAQSSMQSGVCAGALDLAAEHARNRVQFGRPIGTFQAVGQRLADAWIDAEAVRLTSLQAAWRLDAGLPAVEAVAIAKWWAAEAGHRVLHAAHHIHGGIGIDLSYPLHRYFLLAKHNEFTLGNARQQLRTLGRALAAQG